jgi:D-alanine transfer protein
MLLQQAALKFPDVVSIYGSSELRVEMDKRANEIFKRKPRGFQVCPVGAAGNTSLMMAQKIAAQGSALSGRKVAFILSHTWFRRSQTPSAHMEGNFSPLQGISLLLEPSLNEALRRRYVARLLDYPEALENHTLINAYVHCLYQEGWLATLERSALRPLLLMYQSRLQFEDHLNTVEAIFEHEIIHQDPWKARPKRINWRRLIKEREQDGLGRDEEMLSRPPLIADGPNDDEFLQASRDSREWGDFALLLDTLRFLNADALILSVPLPGLSFDRHGVSRQARDYYYQRIQTMSAERGFPAVTFSEHDHDVPDDFLLGIGTHLEIKGWLYVDKVVDDFYHDRLSLNVPKKPDP